MMSRAAYVIWAQEPKNGGMDALAAGVEWDEEAANPNAVLDTLGKNVKGARRCAMKVDDQVVYRDANIRSQGYVTSGPEKLGQT